MSDNVTHAELMAIAQQQAPAGSVTEANGGPAPTDEKDQRILALERRVDELTSLVRTFAPVAEGLAPAHAAQIASAVSVANDILAAWKKHFGWDIPLTTPPEA